MANGKWQLVDFPNIYKGEAEHAPSPLRQEPSCSYKVIRFLAVVSRSDPKERQGRTRAEPAASGRVVSNHKKYPSKAVWSVATFYCFKTITSTPDAALWL